MNPYILLINLGATFLEEFTTSLTTSGAPVVVIEAFKNALTQLIAHKDDEVTKANLEAQRG